MKVIFVCTGNTCRSPMAQYIAADLAEKQNLTAQFDSAGIFASNGDPMSRNAAEAVKSLTGKTPVHLSKRLTKEIFDGADLVVAVTPDHKRIIDAQYGRPDKTVAFPVPVGDPFGGDLSTYADSAKSILENLKILTDGGVIR